MSKEALNKIETHEKECTIRYQNIEKRLDEGAKRFTRIELLIIGLYAGMATIEIVSSLWGLSMYEYGCEVDRVVDGDTIDVTLDLGFDILFKSRVRLYGIDTPESRT